MRKPVKKTDMVGISGIVTAVVLALFLISAAVVLILNFRWLYYLDINLLNIEQDTGMSADLIRANYDAIISYNQVWFRGSLILPSLSMSETGVIHFAEVKAIFDGLQIMAAITGILSLLLGIWQSRHHGRIWMRITGIICLALPVLLGAFAAISWETMFEGFHRIFFRNDYWLFDPATDPVIRILPDTFFLQCACLILLVVLIGGVICLFLSRQPQKKQEQDKSVIPVRL